MPLNTPKQSMLTLMHTHVHVHSVTVSTSAPSLNLLSQLRQTENTKNKPTNVQKYDHAKNETANH